MTHTHAYAVMEVSKAADDEIRQKLEAAGYQQAIHPGGDGEVLDMQGIALQAEAPAIAHPELRVVERTGRLVSLACGHRFALGLHGLHDDVPAVGGLARCPICSGDRRRAHIPGEQ